jgi:hypothetical protein
MGLDRWFELQLQPANMDFTELEQRLNDFLTMRLSTPQLLLAFPSGAVIRQAENGKFPILNTPILRVVYNDQLAFPKKREAQKAEKMAEVVTPLATEKNTAFDSCTTSRVIRCCIQLGSPPLKPSRCFAPPILRTTLQLRVRSIQPLHSVPA